MKPATEPVLLNQKEAARLLNVGRTAFWRLRARSDFPRPVKLLLAERYRRDDLLAWVESLKPCEQSHDSSN